MIDFLQTVLAFVVTLGVLVAVHEFGHFWVARRLGVKVLRFSIGFGRPLLAWRGKHDDTEYVLSAIPLGGYVKMLDEREGEVGEWERDRAFNRQRLATRSAIVVAGPMFNFAFAAVAYWLMFVIGVPGMKPLIGPVEPGTPAAQAQLHKGQEIVQVNDTPTPTWGALLDTLVPPLLRGETVALRVSDGGLLTTHSLALGSINTELPPDDLVRQIGIVPYSPHIDPVIDKVANGSAAERGGLARGDRITAIAGTRVEDWSQVVEIVHQHPGVDVPIDVLRDGSALFLTVHPDTHESKEGKIGYLGITPKVDPKLFASLRGEQQFGPLPAIGHAIYKTVDMSLLTLQVMGKMLIGKMSIENVSGPVSIARYAKGSADAGFAYYLSFLAVVSLSLGVVNLLPVPVLDGGHLAFYLVEAVKGRPVRPQTELIFQKVGLALILSLMLLAIYLDLMRLAD